MDLNHHVWKLVLGGGLLSEVVKEGLLTKRGGFQRVLDLGTGTGAWAVDFADEWVDDGVVVVGNDLSPIQPRVSIILPRYLAGSNVLPAGSGFLQIVHLS